MLYSSKNYFRIVVVDTIKGKSWQFNWLDMSNLNFLKKIILQNFIKKFLNFSDVVITQSKAMKLDLKKYIRWK